MVICTLSRLLLGSAAIPTKKSQAVTSYANDRGKHSLLSLTDSRDVRSRTLPLRWLKRKANKANKANNHHIAKGLQSSDAFKIPRSVMFAGIS